VDDQHRTCSFRAPGVAIKGFGATVARPPQVAGPPARAIKAALAPRRGRFDGVGGRRKAMKHPR
jgi:hypothetical protein